MTNQINTPWGTSDRIQAIAPGIDLVTTPSHGGYHLTGKALELMPDIFKANTFGHNGPEWYEEDCDATMVVLAFPQFFEEDDEKRAAVFMRGYKPEIPEIKNLTPAAKSQFDAARLYMAPDTTTATSDPSAPIQINVDKQEFNTILAALRYYQAGGQGNPDRRAYDIHEIATNGNDSSLDDEAIDQLCQRIN